PDCPRIQGKAPPSCYCRAVGIRSVPAAGRVPGCLAQQFAGGHFHQGSGLRDGNPGYLTPLLSNNSFCVSLKTTGARDRSAISVTTNAPGVSEGRSISAVKIARRNCGSRPLASRE